MTKYHVLVNEVIEATLISFKSSLNLLQGKNENQMLQPLFFLTRRPFPTEAG